MLNGFQILLLIVLLLGIVLISGYTKLMFSDEISNVTGKNSGVAPPVKKSRTTLEKHYFGSIGTTLPQIQIPSTKSHSKYFLAIFKE